MKRIALAAVPLALLAAIPVLRTSPADQRSPSSSSGLAAGASSFSAALFAPGIVSTSGDEFGTAFSPDGATVFFARRSPTTSSSPVQAIFFSRLESGRWSTPEIAPFSGVWPDFAPTFAPDGKRLFFASLRPRKGGGDRVRDDLDIWMVERVERVERVVERSASGWGEPVNLGEPVNSDRNESSPSIAADGTLYFGSDRPGGPGGVDIWRSAKTADGYSAPEFLGDGVNTAAFESQPAVAPDQSFLVFASVGRPEIATTGGAVYPRPDLYASVRVGGVWQPARNLGPLVNTTAGETSPSLAPDGRRLFFTSERGFTAIPMVPGLTRAAFEESARGIGNGRGNIYEIPLDKLGLGPKGGAR